MQSIWPDQIVVTEEYVIDNFSPKLEKFEKRQIWCTDCEKWTDLDEWVTIDLYCETCGGPDHPGIAHGTDRDSCWNCYDYIYDELRTR